MRYFQIPSKDMQTHGKLFLKEYRV